MTTFKKAFELQSWIIIDLVSTIFTGENFETKFKIENCQLVEFKLQSNMTLESISLQSQTYVVVGLFLPPAHLSLAHLNLRGLATWSNVSGVELPTSVTKLNTILFE